MTAQAQAGVVSGRKVTPRRVRWQASNPFNVQAPVPIYGTDAVDNGNTSYTKIIRGGCFLAYDSSGALWAPCKRTQANGSGSSSTSLTVDDATHFQAADSIIIGGQAAQAIVSISGNVITLTSAATWLDNDPVYVSKYGTARGILLDDEVKLYNDWAPTTYLTRNAEMLVAGCIDQDKLLGDVAAIMSDPLSAYYLRNIVYDDYQLGIDTPEYPGGNQFATPWRQVFLSADKTLTSADSGCEFICNAAVNITLPSLATGGRNFRIRAHQISDNNLTVTAPSGKLIALHNATATSIAYSTSSQKIGAGCEVFLLPDFTKYKANNISAGVQAVTVA